MKAATRRSFLGTMGLGAASLALDRQAFSAPRPETRPMKARPDLLDAQSPKGIEVFQLTDESVPSSHVYMEAQVFTPDSKRLILHCSAHPHGSSQHDREHRYLVCDIEGGCRLTPITDEVGATAPSVSPDGKTLYYFVNETTVGGGRLTLKRVGLDGSGRETILVVDKPLPDTAFRPSGIYPLSTISSDGKRLALSAFLGDGNTKDAPFGLMVFDIARAAVRLILQGQTWCNVHPQFCRSTEPSTSLGPGPEPARDILIQENHGNVCSEKGAIVRLVGPEGCDIHVVRDDGSDFRNMPWGRDGNEHPQGHQCWRGASTRAITSTGTRQPRENQLIESPPAPFAGHVGIRTPGAVRNHLTRTFPNPSFCHFGTDIAGRRIVSDAFAKGAWAIYLADLSPKEGEPLEKWWYLLSPRASVKKQTHPHPFLSPDGALAFFNSDEAGVLQAYMIRGLPGLT
jgi:hypothetical protein